MRVVAKLGMGTCKKGSIRAQGKGKAHADPERGKIDHSSATVVPTVTNTVGG